MRALVRLLALAGGLQLGGLACAAPPGPPTAAPTPLRDVALDAVTAGAVTMNLELSANADGPSAMTSTTGSVNIGRATALRVAPADAAGTPARLLATMDVDVGVAIGKAQASGANDATCAANTAISGADYSYIAQSQNFTALAATCACTAMAVGFVTH